MIALPRYVLITTEVDAPSWGMHLSKDGSVAPDRSKIELDLRNTLQGDE